MPTVVEEQKVAKTGILSMSSVITRQFHMQIIFNILIALHNSKAEKNFK